ncbi:class I SAM-dependent methyltransferase [Nocardia sp. NBC_00565]|uniref:class I SAM-dependent methyltransferase n=1 Tax=Nocardia sp. NBC_00565 TaxID=2975993 RepID=UPI002E819050|nr:class I SAM-dependent methyltransferase [Nocardia sp. NBC_00565]WUC03234.1 class I SAM-dependent methyltransferase [Nocardia sp. NBC_00565]
MQLGQPSRTALATAYARAYHQIASEPRIFTDPLAIRIAGVTPDELADLHTAIIQEHDTDGALRRRRRMFLAARARFAEETIADAVAAGTRQVVVLGAGLDTFAYRNPYPDVRVFEVDHPDTQAWKRERLESAGIEIPVSLTFAPVDFESQTLAAGLAAADFDRSRPAVFVWLGVIMYLTEETILDTLRFVAGQATPTQLIFDYLYPAAASGPEDTVQRTARADRVAAIGEPWLSFFTADEIANILRENGFDQINDRGAPHLIAGYLGIPTPQSATIPPHVLCATRTA